MSDLTPERVAELRDLIAGKDECFFVSAADPVFGNNLTIGELAALLAAAEERDRLRAELHALRTTLVEATVEPFDIGPCVIAGPLPLKEKHAGEVLAVQHERMLGVFEQLRARVEAKAAGTTDACNRVWRDNAWLRAQRDALVALLEKAAELVEYAESSDEEFDAAAQCWRLEVDAAICAAKEATDG